jgi:murein DD-endopeptidase MepM/ murein hydrolase activator NlpD
MTSPFGPRIHPVYGGSRVHKGCDFTTDYGTKIRATADGTVTTSDWLGGYGQAVEIDHGAGLSTLYAHCSQLKVKKGEKVRRGQIIALVGMTGLASGPHCHYEVHKEGQPINPEDYLKVRL